MQQIKKACEILRNGGVVGMPTETVYGLAGSIESKEGILNIFKTKERPFFDPLIVHVSSIEQAKKYTADWPKEFDILAKSLWPGPVSFVVKKNDLISDHISSGLDTVALRMPRNELALNLIGELGCPIAAPSANKFKKTSPTTAKHVQSEFPEILTLIDDDCDVGIESTVLGYKDGIILIYRPGMINKEGILEVLKHSGLSNIKIEYSESPVAPGHLKHHYMPRLPIILLEGKTDIINKYDTESITEGLLDNPILIQLSSDPILCARQLYASFKKADDSKFTSIILHIDKELRRQDSWQGIFNRLDKAKSFTLS